MIFARNLQGEILNGKNIGALKNSAEKLLSDPPHETCR
jgi:hypothetical protein